MAGIEIGEQLGELLATLKLSIQIDEGLLGDSVTSQRILISQSTVCLWASTRIHYSCGRCFAELFAGLVFLASLFNNRSRCEPATIRTAPPTRSLAIACSK